MGQGRRHNNTDTHESEAYFREGKTDYRHRPPYGTGHCSLDPGVEHVGAEGIDGVGIPLLSLEPRPERVEAYADTFVGVLRRRGAREGRKRKATKQIIQRERERERERELQYVQRGRSPPKNPQGMLCVLGQGNRDRQTDTRQTGTATDRDGGRDERRVERGGAAVAPQGLPDA